MFRRLICFLRGHRYCPSYHVRTQRIPGRGSSKQFQYTCERCGEPTKWMRWKDRETFNRVHKPHWGG